MRKSVEEILLPQIETQEIHLLPGNTGFSPYDTSINQKPINYFQIKKMLKNISHL